MEENQNEVKNNQIKENEIEQQAPHLLGAAPCSALDMAPDNECNSDAYWSYSDDNIFVGKYPNDRKNCGIHHLATDQRMLFNSFDEIVSISKSLVKMLKSYQTPRPFNQTLIISE